MSVFTRMLKQTATYWVPTGVDLFDNPTFTSPTEVQCRWEKQQERIVDKLGEERVSDAKVFLDFEPDIDGYLYLGSTASSDPQALANTYEIRRIEVIPDLRALKSQYVVYL